MVYQQFINYPNYTVYENIASPLTITGVKEDEIKQIEDMTFRINDFMSGMFRGVGIKLVDFKL